MYNPTADHPPSGLMAVPSRIAAWLDARGRGAWIAAMVLGFVFFWPLGLALVAYITWTNRWSKTMFTCRSRSQSPSLPMWKAPTSGNTAFDAYRDETIRRLEAEQDAFQAFLKRLRDAKDKQEFDDFMDERARANAADTPAPKGPDAARDIAAY